MRIGIEAQRLFRKKKHGMDVVILELIKQLQIIDKSNDYFIYVKEDINPCIEETTNFKIRILPNRNYAFWEQVLLPKMAKKDKVDILHCTSNTGPLYYKGKIILTLHDIIYLEKISFSKNAYQTFGNLYRRFIVPKVVAKCSNIITVSYFEKNNIEEYFSHMTTPVTVIYNGVSNVFRKKDSISDPSEIALENFPKDYILFLGNTAHKKNTVGLLKAYRMLLLNMGNVPTLVITDVDVSYIKQLLDKIDDNELLDNIYVCDYIPYSRMKTLYSNAKLFIYPSLRESFGMPILEAMASGTPVVTSNVTSMPEIAGDSAVLIDPYSPSSISLGMQLLLENKNSIVAKNIKLGYTQSLKFDWGDSAKKLIKIYNNYTK